jgi:4-amino-4-deoxy-L-arabinose transferase-like glycosyltransferase
MLPRILAAAALGALLVALCFQFPATHPVNVGGYDAAYTQGFFDPERLDQPGDRPYLAGSDGAARWSRSTSYLVFPQIGLPAELTLRLRGRDGSPTDLLVLLNGEEQLARLAVGPEWQELRVPFQSGLLKPSDVVIELRATTDQLSSTDPRQVGVLMDAAVLRTNGLPITPYPAQLAWGALAGGLLWGLTRGLRAEGRGLRAEGPEQNSSSARVSSFIPHPSALILGIAVYALAFLLLYRLQPPFPYPLRWLPQVVCAALAAALALRHGPRLAQRAPALLDAVALGGMALWALAVFVVAQEHLTLSVPGVEKDFRVFATRAFDLAEVFRADGFYNLGYPFMLWLATPFTQGNPFLAARLLAIGSGVALLLATWWLGRVLLGRSPALVALVVLALSPFVVQYGLYLGSDVPFAALCTLALAALVGGQRAEGREQQAMMLACAAGALAGLAFLVRHPGLLLLPVGLIFIWLAPKGGRRARLAGIYALAFLLAIGPQLYVNVRDTGEPLYSQQAKNIWLAVFGDGDWGRWGETSNDVTLGEVLRQNPGRFLTSWWANVRGFFGTGGEDTSEFGRAYQLRLLGFPANWLGVVGLVGWVVAEGRRQKAEGKEQTGAKQSASRIPHPASLLLFWLGLYVATVSVGISLPRFFLPLAPVYALAAAWSVAWAARAVGGERALLAAGLLLVALLWSGFGTGTSYVLVNQPADELAAARLVLANTRPGERIIVRDTPQGALDKYSAITHLVVPPPSDDPAALAQSGARLLLWFDELGPPPQVGTPIGVAGRYTLIRLR